MAMRLQARHESVKFVEFLLQTDLSVMAVSVAQEVYMMAMSLALSPQLVFQVLLVSKLMVMAPMFFLAGHTIPQDLPNSLGVDLRSCPAHSCHDSRSSEHSPLLGSCRTPSVGQSLHPSN